MNYVLLMQVSHSHGNLNYIKTGSIFSKATNLTHMLKQIAPSHEARDKEDPLLSLKHVTHLHYKWMVCLQQYVLF